jgi:hypothetical protein
MQKTIDTTFEDKKDQAILINSNGKWRPIPWPPFDKATECVPAQQAVTHQWICLMEVRVK